MEKSTTRSVVKNAACGNNSALAKAVLKDQELKDLILMEMINEIKKEIRLYSKDPACLLKLKSPAVFYQQLLVKCPILAVLLSCLSQPGNLKGLICQTLRRLKLPTSAEILFAQKLPFVYTSTTSR